MINKNSLQNRINNLSKQTGVHQNILLKAFFFDAFLKRLSISKYKDNFIFKGGFLLSTNLGISLRSTMDIDFLLSKIKLNRENIVSTMMEILSINVDDGISFAFQSIEEIRQEDEYGGYNIILLGKLENIKETVSVDIATGDPITPNAVSYKYKCLFNDETLNFKAYNFETIISEKLQTILNRGVTNSRSKDFYDLFIIFKLRWDNLDLSILKEAFMKTCNYRKTFFTKQEAIQIISNIKNDLQIESRWNSYCKKNKFASDVEFKETISAILAFIESIF